LIRRQHFDTVVELLVARDLGAARRGQLNEREFSAKFGEPLQKLLDGGETLLDPLGVVEPIDAHAEESIGRQPELAANRSTRLGHGWQVLEPAHRPFDGDGVGAHQGLVVTLEDGGGLAIDAALHESVDESMKLLQCCCV
jgi:hypothetical protein